MAMPRILNSEGATVKQEATSTPPSITWLDAPRIAPKPEPVVKKVEPIKKIEGCENFREIASKYDWNVEIILQIMKKESGCSSTGHNYGDIHKNWKTKQIICYGSWNVLNVGCVHYKKGEDINDVALNVKKAYNLYTNRGGFGDWTTCKKIVGCR